MNLNKNKTQNLKKNMDDSGQIGFNNNFNININKNNSVKEKCNKKLVTSLKKPIHKRKSKTLFESKGNITKVKLLYYYILPLWIIKRYKNLKSFCLIKGRICQYFSLEKFNELLKFKENLEEKSFKSKIKNIESIKINNNNNEKNSLDDS